VDFLAMKLIFFALVSVVAQLMWKSLIIRLCR